MAMKLLAILTLALAVAANPIVVRKSPVTLPVARRFNFTGSANIREIDQARAKTLKSRTRTNPKDVSKASLVNVPVTNTVVTYTAEVQVGNPARTFNLLVDTGSSNTWVGANPANPFVVSSTSTDTEQEVFVEYGSGLFIGEQFVDNMVLGDITIPQQSLGAAEFAEGFNGVDGILGIGPTDLTDGTTSGGGLIPTVTDNAFSLGLIDAHQVGISFEPSSELSATNGELTFGGVDPSKLTGDVHFVPITSTAPANEFVGIDQTITYGAAGTPILAQTAGITDTGTTLVLIASDALAAYQAATGAVLDNNTGLLRITPAQFANLESLFFHIGDETFEFTPNAQLFPRALNTAIGGDADGIFLIVSDLGSPSGEGFDFVNGFAFLERFYSVFDSAGNRFGIATTPFTNAETN